MENLVLCYESAGRDHDRKNDLRGNKNPPRQLPGTLSARLSFIRRTFIIKIANSRDPERQRGK
ncbi:hypothetical protein KCP77_01120 [Salmonella enterica subsp. enterica]|nr:hypothetical protein KCP77_01120 [Salmonella enterica subsp. enterica]